MWPDFYTPLPRRAVKTARRRYELEARDFCRWWRDRKERWRGGGQRAARNREWLGLIDFLRAYYRADRRVIPKGRTECLVETRQEYKDFTAAELAATLRTLGRLAKSLYSVKRDVFDWSSWMQPDTPNPLARYYVEVLERLIWRVATFCQDDYPAFTDLATRTKQLLTAKENWTP